MQSNHSKTSSDPAANTSSPSINLNHNFSIQTMNRPQNAGMETEGVVPIVALPEGNNSFVGMRISSGLPFPFKLHAMLDNAAEGNYETIVSWSGDNGFLVHDKDAFVEAIIPKYFSQTKYRSFQRLLNMWGFQRLREGPRKGAYYHEQFQRGNSSLCGKMKCEKIKKKPTPGGANANGNVNANANAKSKEPKQYKANVLALESSNEVEPAPSKIAEKKVVTFDKATKPAAKVLDAAAPLPSFEDTFGEIKQIIPVGKRKTTAKVDHPHADTFDPNKQQSNQSAPLPTYSDLFEDLQFHEVSKGDKIARVYGPGEGKK
ncbi:unnamed protein product [Cylindrotheca closterium]|uniref:HSF-type DNA-binding domain-containing protein n=1 Tax=Cylindrotheca closterium TaxID=2856 RepID=A0AAD2FZX8_9STRA|nr:unnamed protein product [Cylindrotheca closterium]